MGEAGFDSSRQPVFQEEGENEILNRIRELFVPQTRKSATNWLDKLECVTHRFEQITLIRKTEFFIESYTFVDGHKFQCNDSALQLYFSGTTLQTVL